MKSKILLSLVILFFLAFTSRAQISPGKILLGGGFGYNSNENTQSSQPNMYSNYKNTYASIQVGKFIKENTAAGVFVSYSHNKNPSLSGADYKITQFNGGLFYRKYKLLTRSFYFFGEGDISYTHSKNEQTYYPGPSSIIKNVSNGGSLSFIPGISYNLFKKMQMELLIPNLFSAGYVHSVTDYTYTNPSSSSKNESNMFSVSANLNSNLLSNFAIGFKFIL